MDPSAFPETLDTARLRLRKHDPAHAEEIFRAVAGDRARLGEHLAWVHWIETLDDEVRHLRDVVAQWAAGEFFDYALFDGDDVFLGNVGVHAINWTTGVCELGYWIVGVHEGRGFVTEAVAAVTTLCLARGFHRVEIRCTPDNVRSARVAERLGFAREACLRESTVDPQGRRRDTLVFAKLAGDGASRPLARPACVTNWADLLEGDESPYPDTLELFGARSRLARALAVEAVEVDHLVLRPGRRGWRPDDARLGRALVFVVDGTPELHLGERAHPLSGGDAVALGADGGATIANHGFADTRLLIVRAACARADGGA